MTTIYQCKCGYEIEFESDGTHPATLPCPACKSKIPRPTDKKTAGYKEAPITVIGNIDLQKKKSNILIKNN